MFAYNRNISTIKLGKASVIILPWASGSVRTALAMAMNRHHPHFVGTYWGAIISPFCAEIVESETHAYMLDQVMLPWSIFS